MNDQSKEKGSQASHSTSDAARLVQEAQRMDDYDWALERVTRMCASALVDAQVYRQKLLKGFGYPNEVFSRAQDYRALNIILSALQQAQAPTCDCGAKLTQCSSCAVADWQAAHPECKTCCPAGPEQAQARPEIETELRAASRELRINANRLCDRNQGGTYEEDCRRSIERIDAALAAASPRERGEQAAAPQWQRIETAPKDGSPLLAYFPQIGVWQVSWSTAVFDDGFWCVSDNKYEDRPLRGWSDEPTHWMPLPEPPTALPPPPARAEQETDQ